MTFYRWHSADAPLFTAANAWSGLWGSDFSADGSRTRCPGCDGTGEGWSECPACHGNLGGCERCEDAGVINECEDCGGDGWRACVRGYSCCHTAADLVAYMRDHAGEPRDDWGRVIVFQGEQTGTGIDDEPCVVPENVIAEMSWTEFKKEYATT